MTHQRYLVTPPPVEQRLLQSLWVIGVPLFVGACDAATDTGVGWLRATVQEAAETAAITTEYEGTGEFYVGRDPAYGVSTAFKLNSDGTGLSAGHRVAFDRSGAGRPGEGRYELAPLKVKDGRWEGFTARYFRTAGDRVEYFTTVSGEVEITRSSGGQIEGTFRFVAVLYCSSALVGPDSQDWCTGPNTITAGKPQVEVGGSFSAEPLQLEVNNPSR